MFDSPGIDYIVRWISSLVELSKDVAESWMRSSIREIDSEVDVPKDALKSSTAKPDLPHIFSESPRAL